MISVQFKEGKTLSLVIKGHGDKLVCASASILAYTLAQNIKDSKDLCEKTRIVLKEGDTIVSCTPLEESYWQWDAIFRSIVRGIDLLVANFPNEISLQRVCPKHRKSRSL